MKDKTVAILTVRGLGTRKITNRNVAKWLARLSRDIAKHGAKYSNLFRARLYE